MYTRGDVWRIKVINVSVSAKSRLPVRRWGDKVPQDFRFQMRQQSSKQCESAGFTK
jgi:hypothetical protein